MRESKKQFIEFMLRSGVLSFGDFITKSGRKTPYFINSGLYKDGKSIQQLGNFYAECIHENLDDSFNVVFGPSYKGIPIAVSTTIALQSKYNQNVNYSFNRKEIKDHGEGGTIVGYTPKNNDNVVIVDDVITAGLSAHQSIDILKATAKVNIKAIIISVDRMEKGRENKSAIQEIEEKYSIPIYPIVTIKEIIDYIYNFKKDGQMLIDNTIKQKIEKRLIKI